MISSEELKILKSFAQRIPDNDPGAHNNLAVVYYNKGLYDDAIEELKAALQIDPNFVLARNNLDIILKKSGRLEEKAKELGRAIDTEPFDEHSTLELADTYRKLSRYSQAIIFYKKVLGYNPGSYEAHFGLGITLRGLGKYDDALEEIKKSLEIKVSPEGYRALGEIYFNKGVIDLAIKSFQESLMIDSASAESHFLLGFALGEKGKLAEGLEEIHKAIAINPALAQLEPNLPIDLKSHKGHWEFLKEQLGMPKSSVNEYQAHYNLGTTYLHKGLFSESKREYEECMKIRPDDAELNAALGEVSIFMNHLDDGQKYLSRSLEIDFSSARTVNDLGIVALKKNDFKDAAGLFQKALANQKDFAPALNNLAVVEMCEPNVPQAVGRFEAASRQGSIEAKYNLGMYFYKSGQYDKVLQLFPDNTADDYFFRGLVYNETSREEESVNAFREVIKLSPAYAGAYFNIGFTLMKTGKYEEGLSFIRKGMEIEPNYEKDKFHLAIAPELAEFGPYYTPQKAAEPVAPAAAPASFFPTMEKEPKAEDYLAHAEECLKQNDLEKARQLTDNALNLLPDFNLAVILKAKILFQGDNYEDALGLLTAYTGKYPDDSMSRVFLAHMLKSMGHLEEARDHYAGLVNQIPDNAEWLAELAEIHLTLDNLDAAVDYFNRLYALNNTDVHANVGLARVLLKKRDFGPAGQYLAYLEKNHPDLYDYNLLAGIHAFETGDHKKAERGFEKAIELDHSRPQPYYHLGLIQVQHGEFARACDNWKKALLLSPDEELSEKITHCLNITMEMLEFLKNEGTGRAAMHETNKR